MAQNIEIKNGGLIRNHFMLVADLAENTWDWKSNGEPPMIILPTTFDIAKPSAAWEVKCII